MHVTDLEPRRVAPALDPVVGRALRDVPRLFHVMHLEVAERDVPCVPEPATYMATCQNVLNSVLSYTSCSHLPPPFGG